MSTEPYAFSAEERVCEVLGTRMAAASALAMPALIHDPTIPPGAFTAGLIKAHLLGAASAILGAQRAGELDDAAADLIVRHASRVIREALNLMVADDPSDAV